MAKRLTEHHPLTRKLRSLELYMDKAKISLEWDGYHMKVIDSDSGETAYLKDNESGEDITEMPYIMETKLITLD